MHERLSARAARVIDEARKQWSSDSPTVFGLLVVLLIDRTGAHASILDDLSIDRAVVQSEVASLAATIRGDTATIDDIVGQATRVARRLSHNYIGCEHLLLALLERSPQPLRRLLGAHGLTPESALEILLRPLAHAPGRELGTFAAPVRTAATISGEVAKSDVQSADVFSFGMEN